MNTFIAGMANSQIDYVLTRRSQADSFAKGAAPLPSLDFSPWRLGARHCPIRATVPMKPGWISSPRRQAPQITYNKLDLEHSIRSNDLRARSLYAEVQARLQQLDAYTAESLNTALRDSCSCIYPRRHAARQPRPWQQPAVQHSVQTMWAHRRLMSRIGHDVRYGLFSVRHVFAAFRAYAQFQRSYRALRTQGRWYRRKLLVDKMLRATQAERSKDARALYQVIREISPLQSGGKVRIRSTDGHLLNPEEEHVEISGYFFQLFGADKPDVQATARLQPIEIYPEELELSLKRLGPGKAVPVGSAPSSAWRYCRSLLSGPLAEAFQEGTMAGYPSRWADCSLTLIPKPNKTNKRPESLRPLGIQDAAGKAVSRVLKQKLFPQIRAALESYPQFAYLEGRSTSDAIQRVVTHCDRIRGKLSNDKHNLRHRKAGNKRLKYQGGAQLTLDMSAAFDRLPRHALEDSLRWAGADEETISILIDMHCACHYKIVHEGFVAYIDMRNGVRQGCTVAPILWATYSVYLLHLIEDRLNSSWPKESMTLYADDTHCAWDLCTIQDLRFFVRSMTVIFEVYRQQGMHINEDKSALIIRMGGTHGAAWLRQHTALIDGKKLFRLTYNMQTLTVPIATQVKYLGIIVSYQDYEAKSVAHRLKAAGISRQRLAKVLHSSKYLSIRQRLLIYQACVRSSILYGVSTFPLHAKDIQALHRRDVKYIRAVAKSPVHITRERTVDLFRRLHIKPIEEFCTVKITEGAKRQQQKILTTASILPTSSTQDAAEKAQPSTDMKGMVALGIPADEIHTYACPTCGLYFPTQRIMRIHHSRKHQTPLHKHDKQDKEAFRIQDVHLHCVAGMPTCKHCGREFVGWQEFKWHLINVCECVPSLGRDSQTASVATVVSKAPETECVQAGDGSARQFAAGPVETEVEAESVARKPLSMDAELCRELLRPQWYYMLRNPDIKQRLQHHCIFCGQWISKRSGALENHLRSAHAAAYQLQPEVRSICKTVPIVRQSPCEVCGSAFASSSKHACTVLQHLCYLREQLRRDQQASDAPGGAHTDAGAAKDVWAPSAAPRLRSSTADGCGGSHGGPGGEQVEILEAVHQGARTGQGSDTDLGSGPERACQLEREARKSSPARQRQRPQPRGQLTILEWMGAPKLEPLGECSVPAEAHRGAGGRHSTTSSNMSQTRGRAQSNETGAGIRSYFRSKSGEHSQQALRQSPSLAPTEGGQGGGQFTSPCALSGDAYHLEGEDEGCRSLGGAQGVGDPAGLGGEKGGHCGAALVVSNLECHGGEIANQYGTRAHAAEPDLRNACAAGGHDSGAECPSTVSFYPQAGGAALRRDGDISVVAGLEGCDGNPSMGHADKLVRQCRGQAHWIADQAHENGEAAHREGVGREISPGSQGQGQGEKCEAAPAASLRLGRPAGIRLANRSNLCYMNASCNIMNWMWKAQQTLWADWSQPCKGCKGKALIIFYVPFRGVVLCKGGPIYTLNRTQQSLSRICLATRSQQLIVAVGKLAQPTRTRIGMLPLLTQVSCSVR